MILTQKILDDPEFGPVVLRKHVRARRITLRLSSDGHVRISLPFRTPYIEAAAFFSRNREWIREALARQRARREAAGPAPQPPTEEEINHPLSLAMVTLPARLQERAARHGFHYNAVRIKRNKSNWGSCSRKGNINLNLSLVLLPEELRDYVLLHELCHLRHPDHSPAFHALLEEICPGHLALQRALRKHRPV